MASITWGILLCAAVLSAATKTVIQNSGRIVGGEATSLERYPWVVQVDFQHGWLYTWSQNCGGSILTSRWILSAAHCFHGLYYGISRRRIRAGATQRNIGGFISYCEKRINHPSYNRSYTNSYDGDITVVQIERPLVWSDVIKPATIVTPNTVIPNDIPVKLVGWGHLESEGDFPESLHHVTTHVIDNDICTRRYAERNLPVTKNMICVGALDVGGKDTCQGDSGGPMFYDDIIIGITSWGIECADPYFSGVSTAVASYTDWITSTVE